jgi:hypothetical protein
MGSLAKADRQIVASNAPPPFVRPKELTELDGEKAAMADHDHSPEQRAWRLTWSVERNDPQWSQDVKTQLQLEARAVLHTDALLSNIACHETVCRVVLQFGDREDAATFIAASNESGSRYLFQSLDPAADSSGTGEAVYPYELLIRRDRPFGLELSRSGVNANSNARYGRYVPASAILATGQDDSRAVILAADPP